MTTFMDRQTVTIATDGTMTRRSVTMPASVVKSSPPVSVTLAPDIEPHAAARLLRRLADELEANT